MNLRRGVFSNGETEMTNNQDQFLAHEVLDRTSIVQEMVDNYLLRHPYVAFNSDVFSLIEQASDALAKAYQLIGEGKRHET